VRAAAKLIAALVLIGSAAVALLAWRVVHGPIPLDRLTPRIEAVLNAPDASVHVSVGATELAWAGWRGGVYLRARAVHITAADGTVVANVPALALRVALRALLHGRFALTKIELLSPMLRLVREPDGRIGLGLGADASARPENPVANDALNALLTSENADAPMAYLRRVEIVDGEVAFEDRSSGLVLRAPRLHLLLSRRAGGIAATLKSDLTLGSQIISVESTAQLQSEPRAFDVQVSFRGVNPAGIAAQLTADAAAPFAKQHPAIVKQLAGITLQLAGSINAHLDRTLQPTVARLELTASPGSVTIPKLSAQRFDLNGVQVEARFDAAADEAIVQKLAVQLGDASLNAKVHLEGLTGAGTVTADAALTGLPVDALGRYWPQGAASGARTWLTTNLSRGTVTIAKAHLRGALAGPLLGTNSAPLPVEGKQQSSAPFTLTELNGSVAFRGLSVRYLETMPPVTDVAGDGTFTADEWDLHVDSGVLRKLRVRPASVTISRITGKEPTRIAIAATVDGPLADALEVLNAEPLGFPAEMGIVPFSVGGDMQAEVGFDFPLGGDIGLDNLGLDVSAGLQNVDIPHVIQGWSVTGGDVKLTVDGTGLDLDGHARVEGTPADIEWHEAFAPLAEVRRRVIVKGQVGNAGRTALGFDLQPWLDGPVGVNLVLTQGRTTDGRIALELDLAPAHIDVPALGVKKSPGVPGRAEGTLLLTKGTVTAVEPFDVSIAGCEIRGHAARNGTRWSTIDATGTLGEVRGDASPPGRFSLGVRPAGAVESFSLTSDDVATLVQAIGLFADGRGGNLDLTGTVDLAGAGHAFNSQVEISDFTVTKAPVLARILTLASLSGIMQTMLSQGVTFTRISAHVLGNTNTMDIGDMVAIGESIGVAGSGSIDLSGDTINFAGSLVPAYYGINKTLGKIPLLRDLFSGQQGLGILGVDFSVSGPLADPSVSVHPLESLTPNIVRRFADLFSAAPRSTKEGARAKP
jgi:hypothetical protein